MLARSLHPLGGNGPNFGPKVNLGPLGPDDLARSRVAVRMVSFQRASARDARLGPQLGS